MTLTERILDVLERTDRSMSATAIATVISIDIDERVNSKDVEKICRGLRRGRVVLCRERSAGMRKPRRYYSLAERGMLPYVEGHAVLAERAT